MGSLGERLRRKRNESGLSLDKIAKELRIGVRLLESIEAEDFEKLPGGVFRKSFVLQYASYLGFDRAAIAAELKHLSAFDQAPVIPLEPADRERPNVPPLDAPRDWGWITGSLGSFTGVVIVVLACAGLWMLWEKYSQQPAVVQQAPPPAAVPVPAPVQETPVPPPAVETTPVAATEPGTPVSVEITTNEETWVQVVSDGKRVFSNAIPANATKKVGANERVRILIGNAGGLQISLNGKPIGPIGPRGQVRTVELTPAGFEIVPPLVKPPASSPL